MSPMPQTLKAAHYCIVRSTGTDDGAFAVTARGCGGRTHLARRPRR